MRLLVTGGGGFIGPALIRRLLSKTGHEVLSLDKFTYAGALSTIAGFASHPRY